MEPAGERLCTHPPICGDPRFPCPSITREQKGLCMCGLSRAGWGVTLGLLTPAPGNMKQQERTPRRHPYCPGGETEVRKGKHLAKGNPAPTAEQLLPAEAPPWRDKPPSPGRGHDTGVPAVSQAWEFLVCRVRRMWWQLPWELCWSQPHSHMVTPQQPREPKGGHLGSV